MKLPNNKLHTLAEVFVGEYPGLWWEPRSAKRTSRLADKGFYYFSREGDGEGRKWSKVSNLKKTAWYFLRNVSVGDSGEQLNVSPTMVNNLLAAVKVLRDREDQGYYTISNSSLSHDEVRLK